ncbi:MAG: phosphatidate cytidylyltransferase [Elusimicrobiota bacterium]|nr:phosphatidate cytidylyltransferase [Elusimicrobiota bacterium]
MSDIITKNPVVFYSLCAVWTIMLLASLCVIIISKLKKDSDHSNLIQRTKSWWMMVFVFSAAVLISKTVSLFFFGFLSFLALKEFFSQVPSRRIDRRAMFWAYLSIPLQFYWIYLDWYGMFIIFIPVYMFLFLSMRMVFTEETEGLLRSLASIQWVLMISVFSLSHAAYLMRLPALASFNAGGAGLMLFLVVITQANDVAQYVWGKTFGKRKILPVVSPKKTWAGFIGGVLSSIVLACLIAPYLTPFDLRQSILAGFLLSVFGFIGDVTISAIKRDLGIKDMGSSIPGHGGIMDRIDSLTYNAPLFFHFCRYFFY